ncbi:hypothetical protein UFOVP240_206 [uncultured Caudovirales phage]|uniref:Baseplate wedge subunit n=1 Tax=uncultured Caudovirales phage TaxID=2100421 RepID=A0A6J7X2S4_9CAUD|nr:hypothetical protein UFOVP240_206 [uncultured Caudovirales phage]
MSRNKISSLVSRQIPEFVREDYPAFVAFVEAYYEWLQTQLVDYAAAGDLDTTLDEFVQYFKKELAYNLPNIIQDDKFYIERIKDLYLAKGSEASYKLLFKLLYNKEVQLSYPGQQLFRASDGRWNQDVSLFAKVMYGKAEDVVGKIVEIETGSTIIKVPIDRRQDIEGEIDRIVALGGNVYEFFIDRKYYGVISPGNRIKYSTEFQAEILPVPVFVDVVHKGSGFKVGQLFKIQSSTGTSTLIKITRIDSNGGIMNAEIIKFGINYLSDFTSALLPTTALASSDRPFSTESVFTLSTIDNGLNPTPINYPIGTQQYDAELRLNTFNAYIEDPAIKFNEQGFISNPEFVSPDWCDGSWAGTLISEFQTTSTNAASATEDPAVLQIRLDAVARYPGYFTTNNGFPSDSIFIQDSKYYQAFSYVIRLDERLADYKSAVKTMLHPAGVELFGEFDVTTMVDLALEVQSMIKSLVIRLSDIPGVTLADSKSIHTTKAADGDSFSLTEPTVNNFVVGTTPLTSVVTNRFGKGVTETFTLTVTPDLVTRDIVKGTINDTQTISDATFTLAPGLTKADSFTTLETVLIDQQKFFGDSLADQVDTLIVVALNTNTKYTMLPNQITTQSDSGYVVLNSYTDGSYFSAQYVNNRDATFSS